MQEKSILITGCSSGIGLATAKLLKKRGYRVFATARKKEDVERLLTHHGLEAIQLDVTNAASRTDALQEILQRTGGTLDALFNNAGYIQPGALEDVSAEFIQRQFETNTFASMELIRLVLPIMREQGHGRIIQNGSILGTITLPYYGAYNASKFALEGFIGTLRQELRGTGIYATIINPGPIATDIRDNAFIKYQETLKNHRESQYQKIYDKMEKIYFANKDNKIRSAPEAVVKKVIHALESKYPKPRYYVGASAQWLAFLKRILPDTALEWILYKISFK